MINFNYVKPSTQKAFTDTFGKDAAAQIIASGINPVDFKELFQKGLCVKRGGISVFEDSMGKPGDTIYSLNDVQISNDPLTIKLKFNGSEEIIILDPENLFVNQKIMGIDSFEKLDWIGFNFHMEYHLLNNKLETKNLVGNHSFKINEQGVGFLFYSW